MIPTFRNVMTTLGDLIYAATGGVQTRLAGDTSNLRKFLTGQASGGVAQAPAWNQILGSDIAAGVITGYITGLEMVYSTGGAFTGVGPNFTTKFKTRAGTNTITTVGTAGSAGTSLMSQIAINDLVGTSAGYARVTAIAGDTSFTLSATMPGGNLTNSAFNLSNNRRSR